MSEQTTPPANGTPRWTKIALVVSVAVNLGVAGIVGGAALRAPEIHRNNVEAPDGVATLARAMPISHQRELREQFRNNRGDLRPDRQELIGLRDRLIAALRTEPFEIEAVNRVLMDQREMLSKITETGHNSVLRQIAQMTPREREAYIRRLLAGAHKPAPRR